MIKFNITADNALLRRLAARMDGILDNNRAPATAGAFKASKETIRAMWARWAMGGELDGIGRIKNPSPKLAGSIKYRDIGPFSSEIYSESRHAERIQKGTPELDMKTTHPYGPKSRMSKEGIPYLIVPFRWGTPNSEGGARAHFSNFIPRPMYSAIQAFKMVKSERLAEYDKKGNITGGKTHFEKNYAGEPVERSEYNWGERIKADGNINGLVRMGSKTRRGGSTYFTFRVISAVQLVTRPYSWIRKAVEPVDVTGALIKTTRPTVEDLIRRGIEADIGI
jgi:hypothetical protein